MLRENRCCYPLFAIVFLFLCCPLFLQGQSKEYTVVGEVRDTTGVIPFSSVVLLNGRDTTVLKMGAADSAGVFKLTGLPAGSYLVQVSALGYKDRALVAFTITNMDVELDKIVLVREDRTIRGVTVTARKPLVQFRPDRTVLNIASSVTSVGSNALELLRKAPGVRVAGEDNVAINGKNGITVYLDGKATNLTGAELITFLRTLPSSAIETIEIITSPSAKYDAAGNAGIIDIHTKKNTNLGLNGNASVTGSYSTYNPKYNGSLDLNYRRRFFNVFGSYNYSDGDYKSLADYIKIQPTAAGKATLDQHFINYNTERNHNYKGGADFFLSSKSTIGALVEGSSGDNNTFGDSRTNIDQPGSNNARLISTNDNPVHNTRINYNLNYRYSDTLGNELTADADYGRFTSGSTSYQPNTYYDHAGNPTDTKIYSSNTATRINISSFKTDYGRKLWKGNLNAGFKYSSIKSDNGLQYFNVINGGNVQDTGRTNQFVYREQIIAGYLMYSVTLNKWDMQLGFRGEHTKSTGTLTTLTQHALEAVDNSYFNLFPTAAINWHFNQNNILGLTYNKRVNRPGYTNLNPFEFVLDELTFFKGNPFLRPQYTDNIKLSHIFKNMLTTSLSYSYNKGYVVSFIDTVNQIKSFETNINMYFQKLYDFTTALQLPVTRWWETNVSFDIYHEHIRGLAGRDMLDLQQDAFVVSTNNTISLPHSWTIELTGYYNSQYLSGAYTMSPQWSVDGGIQKKLLKGNASAKLSLTDIFNTLRNVNTRDYANYYLRAVSKWETRQLKLSFSYRFGNKNVKEPGEHKTSSAEEQGRAH